MNIKGDLPEQLEVVSTNQRLSYLVFAPLVKLLSYHFADELAHIIIICYVVLCVRALCEFEIFADRVYDWYAFVEDAVLKLFQLDIVRWWFKSLVLLDKHHVGEDRVYAVVRVVVVIYGF